MKISSFVKLPAMWTSNGFRIDSIDWNSKILKKIEYWKIIFLHMNFVADEKSLWENPVPVSVVTKRRRELFGSMLVNACAYVSIEYFSLLSVSQIEKENSLKAKRSRLFDDEAKKRRTFKCKSRLTCFFFFFFVFFSPLQYVLR